MEPAGLARYNNAQLQGTARRYTGVDFHVVRLANTSEDVASDLARVSGQ